MASSNYISKSETRISGDELQLFLKMTSIYNPFAKQSTNVIIPLNKDIRSIKLGSSIFLIKDIRKCR